MIDKGLIALHKYMKSQNDDFLIIFDKREIELCAVVTIMKEYTTKFIILDDFIFFHNDFKNAKVHKVDSTKMLNDALKNIFINNVYNIKINDDSIENASAVLFSISNASEKDIKVFEHFLLFSKLPKSFNISNIILHDGLAIPAYTNKKEYKLFKKSEDKPVCVFLGYGIGDFFITSEFWYQLLKKYNDIIIIMPQNRTIKKILFDLFGSHCKFYEIEDYMVLERMYKEFINSGKFQKCYNLLFDDYKMINSFQHYYDFFNSQMFDITVTNPYSHMRDILFKFTTLIKDCEKKSIIKIRNERKIKVGIQFWTDEPGSERNWNCDNVQRLINCGSDYFQFYILTPYPKEKYNVGGCIDLSHFSLYGMVAAINEMDMVVGIDSCCGHIAAAYNIPTITIWNAQTPIALPFDYIKLSFRPMRKNISLVPRSKDINDIKGEKVFEIMKMYFDNKILLNSEIISTKEIFNLKNTFYI